MSWQITRISIQKFFKENNFWPIRRSKHRYLVSIAPPPPPSIEWAFWLEYGIKYITCHYESIFLFLWDPCLAKINCSAEDISITVVTTWTTLIANISTLLYICISNLLFTYVNIFLLKKSFKNWIVYSGVKK